MPRALDSSDESASPSRGFICGFWDWWNSWSVLRKVWKRKEMFLHSTSKPEYQADTQAKYIRQTWFLDCRFELILLLFFRLPYFLASVPCRVINLQTRRSKESLFSWIMICWFSPLCFPHPPSSFQPRPLFLFGLKFATWHSSIQPFCRLIPKSACMLTQQFGTM